MQVEAEGRAEAPARWERFTRGSDVGIRGIGRSVEQAFEMAALALSSLVEDPRRVQAQEEIEMECEARATDRLLADWLRHVVGAMASGHVRFHCFVVRIDGPRLFGHGYGERVKPTREPRAPPVTGATLAEVSVRQGADGLWTAECLVEL
ncbi:archease [Myxococcaceae bacterium JPH2]|nr:archease [Myxococcaceae bacterium JPH2]